MNSETLDFVKEKDALADRLNYREFNESNGRAESADRNAYMRDYARVLYCSSFRQLQGKMQLLAVDEARFNRNRLTHSLEVAQIARGLAASLGIQETIVAETCALIHDIGNPPYGHHGEMILNEFTGHCGGYEGNAQAFRVIRVLEKKHPNCDGLNLTLRVLWGITKYFDNRTQNPKKFLYNDDYHFLKDELARHDIHDRKSIDAQIMDLSDEIAYAAHDLEDALSANLIVIGELLHEFEIDADFKSAGGLLKDIVQGVEEYASGANMLGTSEEYSLVFRKELTSRIVNRLVNDIGVVNHNNVLELGYQTLAKLALGLKKIVFRTVLRKMHIQEYEQRGENVLRGLFEVYSDEKFNKNLTLLPAELRNRKEPRARLICDYLASMMDAFAAREYIKFFGEAKYEALYRAA